jgi:hypothetical protein
MEHHPADWGGFGREDIFLGPFTDCLFFPSAGDDGPMDCGVQARAKRMNVHVQELRTIMSGTSAALRAERFMPGIF